MFFDMMVFKRTALGLEMAGIGLNQQSVFEHPHIWLKDEDVILISTRPEVQANEMALWCRSKPLPGWWTGQQVLEFITNTLVSVPKTIKDWEERVTDWDRRFSRDEQDQAAIEASQFNGLVY